MIMARKERLTVFLTNDLIEAVKICAVKRRKRTSDIVAIALREYLEKTHCSEMESVDIETDKGKDYEG